MRLIDYKDKPIWHVIEKKIKENYQSLMDAKDEFDIVSKEELIKAVLQNISAPNGMFHLEYDLNKYLGSIIVDPNTLKILNGFILYMNSPYGGACSKCRSNLVCIYMPEGFKQVNPEECVHIPFTENIMMMMMGVDITMVEQRLNNGFGILLPKQEYDFYCLSCGEWGKIVCDNYKKYITL